MYEKLLAVQQEIGAIKKDSINPHFKNTYFDINSLLAEVKPVLNKHGILLTQGLTHIEGKLALETKLTTGDEREIGTYEGTFKGEKHLVGGTLTYICPLPDGLDAMKAGAAITYFRRYALVSLLALEAEDNDTAGEVPVINTQRR